MYFFYLNIAKETYLTGMHMSMTECVGALQIYDCSIWVSINYDKTLKNCEIKSKIFEFCVGWKAPCGENDPKIIVITII